ncbi:hypothetical protein NLJ89_g10661 [Agrocybe chaxingu]|uniref:Uncharacterized protein n=1 Tax=Agrocybe chaxingu TaxID=84603 RepID=A0A9W8MRX4_9AGAR|nr:hypothetical protein NLJ89_g10661 [Agrocybe chaxingu]
MVNLLQPSELERRLLRWTSSSYVPRYPFFDTPTSGAGTPSSISPVSPSRSVEDLGRWFGDVELASSDCDVPVEQYPDVAMYFLKGDLKEVMKERKDAYLKQTKRRFWDWRDFKEDLKRLVVEAAKIVSTPRMSNIASDTMEQLRLAHPYIASSVRLGLIIGGTAVLLPMLGSMAWRKLNPPVLNAPQ